MSLNRKVPLKVHKVIEPYLKRGIIRYSNPKTGSFRLVEGMERTEFFFNVSVGVDNHEIEFKPRNSATTHSIKKSRIDTRSLISYLERWLTLISEYNDVNEFSRGLVEHYEREFSESYKFKDEEEENSYYRIPEQKKLIGVLNRVEVIIQEEKNEKNDKKIQEIVNDIEDLKEKLPVATKGFFVKQLHRIFGKLYITGSKILEKVIVDKGAELLGQFVGGVMKVLIQT